MVYNITNSWAEQNSSVFANASFDRIAAKECGSLKGDMHNELLKRVPSNPSLISTISSSLFGAKPMLAKTTIEIKDKSNSIVDLDSAMASSEKKVAMHEELLKKTATNASIINRGRKFIFGNKQTVSKEDGSIQEMTETLETAKEYGKTNNNLHKELLLEVSRRSSVSYKLNRNIKEIANKTSTIFARLVNSIVSYSKAFIKNAINFINAKRDLKEAKACSVYKNALHAELFDRAEASLLNDAANMFDRAEA